MYRNYHSLGGATTKSLKPLQVEFIVDLGKQTRLRDATSSCLDEYRIDAEVGPVHPN